MIRSRLTSKAQTTIPQPVRAALKVREGDEIAYEIRDGVVILSKAPAGVAEPDDPFVHFDEWSSEADRKGYADL
jgi:antitoxin PrlF